MAQLYTRFAALCRQQPLLAVLLSGGLSALLAQAGMLTGMALLFLLLAPFPLLALGFNQAPQAVVLAGVVAWGAHSLLIWPFLDGETGAFLNQENLLFFARVILPALLLSYVAWGAQAVGKTAAWVNTVFLMGVVLTLLLCLLLLPQLAPLAEQLQELSNQLMAQQGTPLPLAPQTLQVVAGMLPGFIGFMSVLSVFMCVGLLRRVQPEALTPMRRQPLAVFVPLLFCASLAIGSQPSAVVSEQAMVDVVYYARNLALMTAAPLLMIGFSVLYTFGAHWSVSKPVLIALTVFAVLSFYPLLLVLALGLVEPFTSSRQRLLNGSH
ncbi:MAG: hypothetical protein LW855_01515 [Alphaproteobacteria bacterium]|nr:hypothetical protein [Alphaproteobacteria bacterium]